jgi:hypothetical protein
MEDRKPPTWDEIQGLIRRVDEVCRESEYLRGQAERARHRPTVWPERRKQPSRQSEPGRSQQRREEDVTPEGSEGSI